MKALIWFAFLLLAGLWTGLVALAVQISEWLLASVSGGQANDLAAAAGQFPVPAWLGLWADTAWLKDMQTAAADLVQWLVQVLPSADGLMGWITPLLWVGWGLGVLVMLVCTVAAHWLLGRGQGLSTVLSRAGLTRRA